MVSRLRSGIGKSKRDEGPTPNPDVVPEMSGCWTASLGSYRPKADSRNVRFGAPRPGTWVGVDPETDAGTRADADLTAAALVMIEEIDRTGRSQGRGPKWRVAARKQRRAVDCPASRTG